jgi:hypothetical protein
MDYDVLFAPVKIQTLLRKESRKAHQAPRVVVNITSDIERLLLIDGIRSSMERNTLLKEILLIYKGKFYRLPKALIQSKKIFNLIK